MDTAGMVHGVVRGLQVVPGHQGRRGLVGSIKADGWPGTKDTLTQGSCPARPVVLAKRTCLHLILPLTNCVQRQVHGHAVQRLPPPQQRGAGHSQGSGGLQAGAGGENTASKAKTQQARHRSIAGTLTNPHRHRACSVPSAHGRVHRGARERNPALPGHILSVPHRHPLPGRPPHQYVRPAPPRAHRPGAHQMQPVPGASRVWMRAGGRGHKLQQSEANWMLSQLFRWRPTRSQRLGPYAFGSTAARRRCVRIHGYKYKPGRITRWARMVRVAAARMLLLNRAVPPPRSPGQDAGQQRAHDGLRALAPAPHGEASLRHALRPNPDDSD